MLLIALKKLIMPPLCLFLAGGLGWALYGHWPRLGRALMVVSALSLFLLCLPWVASALNIGLQNDPPVRLNKLPSGPQAIVVLGADVRGYTPELGRPDVGPMTLTRLRYGALLARASGLPMAVSGGVTVRNVPPIGELMARVLEEEQGLRATWVETRSKTTWENAEQTAALLRADSIDHIYLVSHAWHLPRARLAFEGAGLKVVPAPTDGLGWPNGFVRGLIPSGSSLRSSCFAIHEYLGRVWYRWLSRSEGPDAKK